MSSNHRSQMSVFRAFGASSNPAPSADGSEPPAGRAPSSAGRDSILGRRQRGASVDVEDVRAAKRLESFTVRTAHEYGIPKDDLIAFSMLSDREMLITIRAEQTAMRRAKELDESTIKLRSGSFAALLRRRVLACLCSPNITAYVTDEINDHVMSMICQDPAAFKIPVGIFHDPDLAEELAAKVGAAMTKQRSRLRATLIAGIEQQIPIASLTKRMVGRSSVEITAAHWSRVAFLRKCVRMFNLEAKKSICDDALAVSANSAAPAPQGLDPNIDPSLQDPRPQPASRHDDDDDDDDVEDGEEAGEGAAGSSWGHNELWMYVDDILAKIRAAARVHPTLDYQQALDEEWILTYQQDISQYPMADPPRAVPLQSSQPWQRIMESTLQWDKA